MYQALFDYIEHYSKIILSDEEKVIIQTIVKPKKFKKKQYLLREGQINEYAGFVIRGALRLFSVDENGNDHILRFCIEDWWAVDMSSFMNQTPSLYFIETREDTEVLMLPREKLDILLEIPSVKAMFWHINQNNHIASQKRGDEAIYLNAKKRYENFSHSYPQILQRFPLGQIASYLGISRETLSRLRKQSLD